MLLDGEDITALPAPLRTRRGLGRAFQLTQLFPNLTVLENVRLAVQAREQRRGMARSTCGASGSTAARGSTRRARSSSSVRLADKRDVAASSLPHGDQRKLEVAMLMALDPKVYMFDEPTAGMSVDDVPVMLDLIRALKARSATARSCSSSTRWTSCASCADRIIVLHNGQLVADGEPADGDRLAGGAAGLPRHGAPEEPRR